MSQDWTEKYRPDHLTGIIGNPKAVSELKAWAKSWDNGIPDKRAVVLIGTPGIGKTSAAVALANDMNWGLIEMNASDQRTGDAIRSVALRGAFANTFTDSGEYKNTNSGGRKLIILDEADNLFGREDKGALPVIVELIKETRQPVILIVNDIYALNKKSSVIKAETLQITLMRPRVDSIAKALKSIAEAEDVAVTEPALIKMAENSNGDMRAAIRNLESLALGKDKVTEADASLLSDRIIKRDMYDLMTAVFRKGDVKEAKRLMMDVDEPPETVMLWMDENIPHEFTDTGDLVRGYEKLSRADIFLGRVRRRQYYGFWPYATDLMVLGLITAKFSKTRSTDRLRFPMYLMKMSRSKSTRTTKKELCMKLAVMLHTSTKRVSNDVLHPIGMVSKNDSEFRLWLVKNADLDAEELAFLLNEKIDSKIVKDTIKAVTEPFTFTEEKEMKTEPAKTPSRSQKSLFEF